MSLLDKWAQNGIKNKLGPDTNTCTQQKTGNNNLLTFHQIIQLVMTKYDSDNKCF